MQMENNVYFYLFLLFFLHSLSEGLKFKYILFVFYKNINRINIGTIYTLFA